MPLIYFYSIASVVIVSIVSFVGALTLSLNESVLRKNVFLLVSLAVGALIGDAFIHLIPEALEKASSAASVSLAIIGGILIFFILEKILHWHHHRVGADGMEEESAAHTSGRMILVSDGIHNFIDGLIIAASYLAGIEIGIATTIAVILHEIPQEIGDFGVLIHSGYSTARALLLNFFSALFAVAGALIALFVGAATETLAAWLVPIAAGGFIYIAMSDLIPEIHKVKGTKFSVLQFAAIIVGVAAMFLLLFLE